MEDKRVTKKQGKKHLWKPEEDLILKKYVETHGEGNWATVSQQSGLMRSGKSCRLRWKNYLRPNIKRGDMSEEEQDLIIRMHKLLGNRWSLIAGRIPGRTDNEVKNYWNTHLNKGCQLRNQKRKHADKNESHNSETKRKRTKAEDSNPIISESQKSNTDKSGQRNKEVGNSALLNPSLEEIKSFNYNMESPIMAGHGSMLFFADEPFTNYIDSFLFLEAFGSTTGEDYAVIGMQ